MKTLFAVIVGLAVAVPSVADAPTSSRLGTLQGHTSYASSVAFSPDGKILACDLVLWDVANQSLWASLQDTSYVYAVAFSSDGTMLASGGDNTVALWDVTQQRRLAILEGHAQRVNSLAFSSDGTILASGAEDGTVLLWRSFSQ